MSLVNKMHMVFPVKILIHQCNTVPIVINLLVINEAGNSHRVVYSFNNCFLLFTLTLKNVVPNIYVYIFKEEFEERDGTKQKEGLLSIMFLIIMHCMY